MQPKEPKWAFKLATFTGSIAIALILLALASILIKALSATPSPTEIQIPLWLTATANATPINGLALLASAAAATALILAAAQKFDLFRESKPHLTISQKITSRQISPGYALIMVTTTLHNTSKVLVTPTQATCRLSQTSPMTDADVEEIYQNSPPDFLENRYEQFGWWLLDKVQKDWLTGETFIEPNEKHQETFQFIIDSSVDSVAALTAINIPYKVANFSVTCYTLCNVHKQDTLEHEEKA